MLAKVAMEPAMMSVPRNDGSAAIRPGSPMMVACFALALMAMLV